MTDDETSLARMPRRTEQERALDLQLLGKIAATNPAATSDELALIFRETTGKPIAARTIRDDLREITKMWLTEYITKDFNQIKSRELARLDALEQEAWGAWRESRSDFFKTVVERARNPAVAEPDAGTIIARIAGELASHNTYVNEEVVEAIVRDAINQAMEDGVDREEEGDMLINRIIETTEGRVGDVSFLREILKIQQDRRRVLGVYAPELHQIDVKKVEVKGYIGWSPAEWENRGGEIVDGVIEEEGSSD